MLAKVKIMREELIETIEREKLVVIVRGVERKDLIPLVQALYEGGVRCLEITYSASGAVSDEQTADNIRMLADRFLGKVFIGAGTVLTEKQVGLTKAAGGTFIVSPDTCPEVIKKTRELGLVSVPGAFTPTEMQAAHRSGADFIKLFPSNFGAAYVKTLLAPLSHLRFLAVGGVEEKDLPEYLEAGACGFGIGAAIVDKTKIKAGDWAGITDVAKKYVAALR